MVYKGIHYTGVYNDMQGYTRVYIGIQGYTSVYMGILGFTIHQIFSLAHDWSKRVTWANIPQLKYPRIFPNF